MPFTVNTVSVRMAPETGRDRSGRKRAMSRILPLLIGLGALTLAACTRSQPAKLVTMVTGCDGPQGSCAKYIAGVDSDGAPTDRGKLLVPLSGKVKVAGDLPWLNAVIGATNLETAAVEFRQVPVSSFRVDPQDQRQLVIEFDALLSDGAGIEVPAGTLVDESGKPVPAFTARVKTPYTPMAVALAAVNWQPEDKEFYSLKGLQKAQGSHDEVQVRAELEGRLRIRPGITDEQVAAILARYDSDQLKKKAPDPRIRAGLVILTGTSGEPAIAFIESDTNRRGVPFEPIKIQSLKEYGAFAAVFYHPYIGKLQMMVDTDMANESLEHIGVVLTHEVLHSSLGGGSASEETLAMASDTRVYEEFLLWDPELASIPTAFTRNANRLALALRNSGRFGYPMAGILARPGVQDALMGVADKPARSFRDLLFAPDFYGEIPRTGDSVHEIVEGYYMRIAGTTESPGRLRFDQSTIQLFDKVMDRGFTDEQILTVNRALKLKPVPRGGQ